MRRNDKRGAMPFAVVAVAILLASAACGAIAADYERAAQESRSGEKDAEAVDAAIGSMRGFVNRGLAEIIRDVSLSDGNVEDRVESFDRRAETWLYDQFPMTEDGVRAELVSHDVGLEVESLRLVSSEEAPSGYVPAYLEAVGTVSVRVQTNTGSAETDLDVSTDGSCVLPLAAEQGSLFERMAGEGSVSLSEIMSYQLSGLAQIRVLNGYGAASARGPMGTDRIVTKEDVLKAYDEALVLLSMICFRDGEGRIASAEKADPATILASKDGKITIDLQAAYAQVLMSLLDDMALKWFDYLPGNGLSKNLQSRLLPYRAYSDALTAFLKGEEAFSAAPYLREMMDLNGVPEDVYRYPGSGKTPLSAPGTTIEIENPSVDVLGTDWIRHFRSDYDTRENWVVDYARNVLRAAVLKVGDRTGLGSVTAEVDPYSGERMAEAVSSAVDGALKGLHERFQESVTAALAESCAADPFYSAICDGIAKRKDSYVLEEEFERRARTALTAALGTEEAEKAMSGQGYADALEAYRGKVYADLEVFDRLERIPGGQNVFVRMIMSEICSFGMEASGIASLAGARMSSVCKEMCDVYGMNPYGGPIDMPGSPAFQVEREGGGVSFETIKATISSSPAVSGPFLDEGSCIHSVGFGEGASAAYSATYSVSIEDDVSYGLKGFGSLSSALGTPSCVVSGSFHVSVAFEVSVVSGWSLQGIDYKPSCTFADDLEDSALKALEPILEPLRKFMEVMGLVMTAVGERIADAARMIAEYVRILYDDLIAPLTEICEWARSKLDEFACQLTESFLIKIGLKDQSISMKLYGYDLTITSDLVSLTGKTKTLFSIEMGKEVDGRKVTAGVTLKTKGGLNADDIRFVGFGSIKDPGDKSAGKSPWNVKVRLDPFMKSGKHLLTVDGRAGKTSVSLVLPEMVQYHELGLRLSDVPGVGAALSNIPLPLVGAKASLDAGFSLKYDAPMKMGLVINEFETNPAGDDKGGEWVELFNNSESTVELDGYTLTASSDWRSKVMPLSGSISPGEFMEIEPDFVMVNSSGKYTRSGEALTLKDADGAVVDKTPTVRDNQDDGKTWHREFDGGTEWTLSEGTPGSSNGSRLNAVISAGDLKDIAWDSVQGAFGDVGYITDAESLEAFLKSLVRRTVDGTIEKVTGCIVEASVYVEVSVSDLASTTKAGFRIALRTDSRLAEDCLKFVAGKLESLILGIEDPYSISIGKAFMEDVDLEICVGSSIGLPEILTKGSDIERTSAEVVFRSNLAAISALLGDNAGRPETVCGVRICGCPLAAIPDGVRADKNMDRDLWLMRLSVQWAPA